MATKTFYTRGGAGTGSLSETDGTTADYSTGWTRAKVGTGNYADVSIGTKLASTAFGAESTDKSSATVAYRSDTAYTGTFASGTWTFTLIAKSISNATGSYALLVKLYRGDVNAANLVRISP